MTEDDRNVEFFSQKTNQLCKSVQDKLELSKIDKDQLQEEKQSQVKEKSKLELYVRDLEDSVKDEEEGKKSSKKELLKLDGTREIIFDNDSWDN